MTTEIPDETAMPGAGPSDAELISAVREGDSAAFGQLYTRHVDAARRLARTLVRGSSDVDDLVAETFAKLLGKLKDGGGPDTSFRAYLLTSLRNTFYDRTRRDRRVEVTDDLTRHDPGVPFVDTAVEGLERSLAARAFARLPERWQMVLWHTEVEGDSPAEVAPLLGLTPNGVSALAYRARERLRQAYLQEHLNDAAGDECSWTIERLGAHVAVDCPAGRAAGSRHTCATAGAVVRSTWSSARSTPASAASWRRWCSAVPRRRTWRPAARVSWPASASGERPGRPCAPDTARRRPPEAGSRWSPRSSRSP